MRKSRNNKKGYRWPENWESSKEEASEYRGPIFIAFITQAADDKNECTVASEFLQTRPTVALRLKKQKKDHYLEQQVTDNSNNKKKLKKRPCKPIDEEERKRSLFAQISSTIDQQLFTARRSII